MTSATRSAAGSRVPSPLPQGWALVWWVVRDPLRPLLLGLLAVYRTVVSPLYGQVCRYYPSCSAYAVTAVREHGSVRGSWLAIRRLARCHPWAAGGVDHVPPRGERPAHRTGLLDQTSTTNGA
jgi:putative membrane protein insertion efficiency factor